MATHFGQVSYQMQCRRDTGRVSGFIDVMNAVVPRLVLHVRLPNNRKINPSSVPPGATIGADGTSLVWRNASQKMRFELAVQ